MASSRPTPRRARRYPARAPHGGPGRQARARRPAPGRRGGPAPCRVDGAVVGDLAETDLRAGRTALPALQRPPADRGGLRRRAEAAGAAGAPGARRPRLPAAPGASRVRQRPRRCPSPGLRASAPRLLIPSLAAWRGLGDPCPRARFSAAAAVSEPPDGYDSSSALADGRRGAPSGLAAGAQGAGAGSQEARVGRLASARGLLDCLSPCTLG